MPRLFPFFLLLVLVPTAMADSVYSDGEATGDLVGDFAGGLNGQFVALAYDADGATITIPDGVVEIQKPLGVPEHQGPMVDFGDVQVHDNAYGWVHIQGAFSIRADDVEVAPRGLALGSLALLALDLEWDWDGQWLHVDAADSLISNNASFQRLGPEPGAWALLQGGDGVVMDWVALGEAPFKTTHIGDDVVMDLVGTLGEDAPDLLVRIEESGHFAPEPDRFVLRLGSLAAAGVPAQDLQNPRGGFTFHGHHEGHNIIQVRLPEGLSGEVRWHQDLAPPRIDTLRVSDTDPYAPLLKMPEMLAVWNEPVWAELHLGGQTKVATQPAQEVRFRLTGLQPDTTYSYTLHGRDLAGNTYQELGNLTTGPRAGPSATINVTSVSMDEAGGVVEFQVHTDDGERPALGLVHVFIDKRASDDHIIAMADGFRVSLPPGASEVRIEVQAPWGRVSEVIDLRTPGEDSPVGWWLPLVLVAFLAWRRR